MTYQERGYWNEACHWSPVQYKFDIFYKDDLVIAIDMMLGTSCWEPRSSVAHITEYVPLERYDENGALDDPT